VQSQPSEPSYSELVSTNQQLAAENKSLREDVTNLLYQLKQIKRAMYGKRSERQVEDSQILSLFSTSAPAAPQPIPTEQVERYERRKAVGRLPLDKDLPRERIEYHPEDLSCKSCGKQLKAIGEEISEELEFIPARLFVREHARIKYACPCCKNKVEIAPLTEINQVIDRGRPGPGLLSHILLSKFEDHLPLERQAKIFEREGVKIAPSTLHGWSEQSAEIALPVYQALIKELMAANLIHADDIPVTVNHDGRYHKGYLWGYRAGNTVVYDFTTSRSSEHPVRFLGKYSGYLQTDGYAGYNAVVELSGAIRVACMAHARRKFFDAKSTDPPRTKRVLDLIAALYQVEREAKEKAFSLREKLLLRQEKSLPIVKTLEQTLWAFRDEVLPKSPVGEAIGYTLTLRKELTVFLDVPFVRLDNNPIEQQLRPIALGRKNYMFFGSEAGGKRAAIFYSLINSAKLHKLNTFDYLQHLLSNVRNSDPALLTPAALAAALSKTS
jgi:transposase